MTRTQLQEARAQLLATRVRLFVKVALAVVAFLFTPLPLNGNQPPIVNVLGWLGLNNPQQVAPAANAVAAVGQWVNDANAVLLGGSGGLSPVVATGVQVAATIGFALYWFCRAHTRQLASPAERLIRTAGPLLLALLALASPVFGLALCGLHLMFTWVTPSRESVLMDEVTLLRAIIDRLTGGRV